VAKAGLHRLGSDKPAHQRSVGCSGLLRASAAHRSPGGTSQSQHRARSNRSRPGRPAW
jgi:hypothetical protein